MDKSRKIEIQPLVELGIFLFALLGTIVPLHIHLDSKMEKRLEINRKETNELILAIKEDVKNFNNEMRDFHTRLYVLEERNRGS